MATGAGKWIIGVVLALAGGLVVVAIVSNSMQRKRQAILDTEVIGGPVETPAAVETSVDPAQGTLTVWVPTGIATDDYWVYLDGHIVSSPPHSNISGKAGLVLPTQTDDDENHPIGWDIFFTDSPQNAGSFLYIRHGFFVDNATYRGYIKQYLDPASGDSMGLFSSVNLPIQPGNYTVEVAYLNDRSDSSFPFAISPKYQAIVEDRRRTELYIGVPDDWVQVRAAKAAPAKPDCDRKPDVSDLTARMNDYLDDPAVQALSMHKEYSNTDGVVTLDLPIDDGGSREFDSAQIRDMAGAILGHYYIIDEEPSQSYIDDCENSHPEWSASFDEYGKLIGDVRDELQFVHRLASR